MNEEDDLPKEEIVAEAAPERPTPPMWLLQDRTEPEPSTPADSSEAGGILVDAIDLIHDKVADATHYEKFRLDDKMRRLWERVLKFLFKYLPSKDWPMIVVIAALVMAYGGMISGYMEWRKQGV